MGVLAEAVYDAESEAEWQKVTNKQRVFIEEYLKDFNATRAAKAAGYSAKSARLIGHENITKPYIAEEIKARMEERKMGADETLVQISDIGHGDMGDFLDIGSMGFMVDLESAKEKGLTKLIKKVKLRTVTTLSKDGVETETHDMEIELYDKLAALVNMGRHHALFTDKSDITSGGKPLDFSRMTDEQLARLAKGDDPANVIPG